jgi:hypothetical protein
VGNGEDILVSGMTLGAYLHLSRYVFLNYMWYVFNGNFW